MGILYIYSIIFFVLFSVFTADKKTFKLNSNGNLPTIHKYDCLIADMDIYNSSNVNYGDWVLFEYNNQTYIYRVVGLANDTIEIIDKKLIINGKRCHYNFVKYSKFENDSIEVWEEILPNSHKHQIYKYKWNYESVLTNYPKTIVPNDQYFLLGDFRDIAIDSRSLGFINHNQIKGKAIYSYWGESLDRMFIDFTNK